MPAHADPTQISDHVHTEGHGLDASELRRQLLNVVKHGFYARTVFGRLQGYWKLGWMVSTNIRARGVDRISVQWASCPVVACYLLEGLVDRLTSVVGGRASPNTVASWA